MANTYEELLEQAAIIRDETAAGKNTATRVGGTITDAVCYVKELQDTYAGIHAEAAEAKTAAAAAKTTAAEAKMNATVAMNTARSASLNATAANGTANAAKATADGIAATAQEAKEAADAAQTAAETAQTTANALLQEIPWEGYHMNAFTDTGEYHIHGESTDANDGLPILNSGTIDARLTVLDSSLTNGTGDKTDTVVTQILRLSNRMGGDGHVYVRTAQAATKSQLATPSSTAWGTWEKLMGMFEKNAVTNIADLDTYTTNGMYSGLFANTTLQTLGGLQFTPGDTFLLITVNGYAASAFGTPQLTQMLYRLPSKKGSGNSSARMYMRTAYWKKDAEPKKWEFANWDRLATASEISGGGGGSIEEYNRLIELITANTEKISSVESTANAAKSAAETAQTAATNAQETATDARETATAASTAAQEAQNAADTAQTTAETAQNTANDAKQTADATKSELEGATSDVEVDYEGVYEHQYFSNNEPYLQTFYLASSINSLVAFPITKDNKYKIDIPKSPKYYSKVAVYSNILPVDGEGTLLYNSSSSAVVIPTETGDANPMTVNIDAAENYSYIIVCYQTDGGVPTCMAETKTKGIKAEMQGIKSEIGNLNELTTTHKASLVGAINEIKDTPSIKIDDTLSKEGEAADAKAVGVAINGTTSRTDVASTDIYANAYFGDSSTIPNTVIVNYNTAIISSIIVYPLIYGAKYELHIPKSIIRTKVWAYLNEQPIAGQQKYCEGVFVDDTMGDGEGMDLFIDAALDYKYLAVCYIPNSGVPTLKRVETSGGLYSKIGNLEALQTENKSNLVAAINEAVNTPIEICLPDKIYAVVGDTLQLFLRSVIKAINPYNYSIKITCNKGQQFSRYFEYTPTASDVGTTDFIIAVRNNNGVLLGSKTCSLITAAAPTSPSSQINIASFGDSLSGPGKWQEEACRRLIGSGGTPAGHRLNNIAFVGKITKDGWLARWCGYGGWTWSSYTSAGLKCFRFIIPSFTSLEIGSVYTNNGYQYTVAEVNPNGDMLFTTSSFDNVPEASGVLTKVSGNGDATLTFTSATRESTNPLWDADNNKMSFIPYANQYCNGQIDVVIAQLGWNGMASAYQTDFSSVESKVKQFADCLHSEFPHAKLKILGLALPSQNGACSSTYSLTTVPYSDTYGLTVNVINLNKLYQQIANESGYSDFVEYIPVAQQFDAENSYPFNVRLKNNRIIIKPFVSDGYYKIGDIVKHENNFYICTNEGIVGQWEDVYKAYLPFDPYERFDTNAVHPSDVGYNQIADAVYRNIAANYCQGI